MTEPRITFEEHGLNSVSVFRLYDDRIEHDWKELPNRGHEVYPAEHIAGRISEQTTFAYGISRPLGRSALSLIVGLVLHFGYEHPALHCTGFVLYGFSGLSALFAILGMKKDTWLYVKKPDGSTLFLVREKGLRGISREQFFQEIQHYAKNG